MRGNHGNVLVHSDARRSALFGNASWRSCDRLGLPTSNRASDRSPGIPRSALPTGISCEDAWVVASSLMAVTTRMRFLVAVRPGLMSASLAARMAATFDRLSGGRLLVNVVTGGNPVELAGDGLHLDHDERYALTDEFLTVSREIAAGGESNFVGDHLHHRAGKLIFRPVQRPYPPLYFGGSSPIAQQVAAKHVDVYLTWGEPPDQVAEKIAQVRREAARHGRQLRFGIRLHVIVRKTDSEAWQAAERLIAHLDEKTIAAAQASLAQHDSVGQQRMRRLACWQPRFARHQPESLGRRGIGAQAERARQVVGDPETVAARLQDTPTWASTPSFVRAIRISRKPIAWPSCCFPCCRCERPRSRPRTRRRTTFRER